MNLDLNRLNQRMHNKYSVKNFIQELSNSLEAQNNFKGEKLDNIELTEEEDLLFYRKEAFFLQKFFKKELEKGEIFIVTNKYENDFEYNRYKVAQYKDNKEYKYIVFKNDLPVNVQLGDVVRKIDGRFVYDKKATQFVKNYRKRIKREIINNRK